MIGSGMAEEEVEKEEKEGRRKRREGGKGGKEEKKLESKGPIESPQLKETPNYQSGAPAISENDLT